MRYFRFLVVGLAFAAVGFSSFAEARSLNNPDGVQTADDPVVWTGTHTNTSQPCFLVTDAGNTLNVTGSGTVHTVAFDTEIFDIGDNFSANTFTAPVTGTYILQAVILLKSLSGVEDAITLKIETSNRGYPQEMTDTNDLPDRYAMAVDIIADMDTTDTATVTIMVSGNSADNVDVVGGSLKVRFSGCLLF